MAQKSIKKLSKDSGAERVFLDEDGNELEECDFSNSKSDSEFYFIENKAPHISLSITAYEKMRHIVSLSDDEVGWIGLCSRNENIFTIEDVFVPKQEVDGATNELTQEGLKELAKEILSLPDGKEKFNNLRLWGHSHVNMDTDPSPQDEDQLNIFKSPGLNWFIRVIANKSGTLSFTLFLFEYGIGIDNVPWSVNYVKDDSLKKAIADELKKKVTGLAKFYHSKKYNPSHRTLMERFPGQTEPEEFWMGANIGSVQADNDVERRHKSRRGEMRPARK